MARALVYTLEPLEHGGVIAKVRVVDALLRRFGHSVELLYTATEQAPTTGRGDLLRYFVSARPRWETNCGFRGLAIPHWPLPLGLTYALPYWLGRPLVSASPIQVVVSGSNHCGLPAALARRTYIVWIGTLYREELEGKAAAGDAWARRMLSGPGGALLDREERLVFERAALILTNGPHTAAAIRRRYPQLAGKTRVMIYPVDTGVFRPDPGARPPGQRPYLLFTARINDSRKNIGLLLEALAQAREVRPDLELVLTGNDPAPPIRARVDSLGLGEAVRFVGYQPVAQLVRLYQGAELFVLSSTQEGLGISLLEAMACGLPVVSTRCGGPEGVIADGEAGLLVENGDARAFANAILALLADPARMAAMRANCVEYARTHFARSLIESRLLDAFKTVYVEHFAAG